MLSGGRFEIISIGFVIALWSGSRALNVFVDTITIMYGLAGERGMVETRALSFALYLVFLLVGIVLLPLVLAGPALVDRSCRRTAGVRRRPLLAGRAAGLGLLPGHPLPRLRSGAYALAVRPARRRPHPADVDRRQRAAPARPRPSAGSTSIYGPLAAPIAVLIWLYIISLGTCWSVPPSTPPSTGLAAALRHRPQPLDVSIGGQHSHNMRIGLDRAHCLAEAGPVPIAPGSPAPPGGCGPRDLTARRFVDFGRTKSMMCHQRAR